MNDWVTLAVLALLLITAVPVLLIVALVSIAALKRRVAELETRVTALRAAGTVPPPAPARPAAEPLGPAAPPVARPPAAGSHPWVVPAPAAPSRPVLTVARGAVPARPKAPGAPSAPGFGARVVARARGWFTGGNVPVKVGMLVLLAGVAALLKYANDQGWLRLPIELRLIGVAAAAIAALVLGWCQRTRRRSFALAVQGGAVGVLLLAVFAAFKRYDLIDAAPAFGLSVVLVAGLAVLAVLQDSRTLAILGVLAGFLAPLWLSDGNGNHVVLFAYYALLNAGVLAIAWIKPWRMLNLLGFAFTWGIAIAWGALQYTPEKFATTEPFLLLFFAFHLALPVLYAWRAPAAGDARITGSLLFGTPLVAFTLQAVLLRGDRMPLALCALGLAALYAALAWSLIRRERFRLLAQGYAVLAAGFATLAVPLALSARATASVFALEGAGLVWLGFAQPRRLVRWSGVGLQLLAGVALAFAAWAFAVRAAVPIANGFFMGAVLVAVAGFATAWLYRRAGRPVVALLAYGWALAWWLGDVATEIHRYVAFDVRLHALLALVAVTGWLAAEVYRRVPARALPWTTFGCIVAGFLLAVAQWSDYGQPFAGPGALAWTLFAVLGVRALGCLGRDDPGAALAQFAWWLLWPFVLSLSAWRIAAAWNLADGWVALLLALPWLALAAVALRRWPWLAAMRGGSFARWRPRLLLVAFMLLGCGWLVGLARAGDSAPLPWVAVLNPLDLAAIAVLVLAARWWRQAATAPYAVRAGVSGLVLAALVLITAITLRAVHHWGGAPWDGTLLHTGAAQTSLTVVWSLLGVIAWIHGSRRGQWGVWLVGAILMGVVLAKLLLVDRAHLGSLLGIGGFIAYGLLCTLVGWLAPAPPRRLRGPRTGVGAA